MRIKYLECGQIVGSHGVRGELRVVSWGDGPEFLLPFKTIYRHKGTLALPVLRARIHKDLVLMTLEGITTKEQADALRGETLYIDRADDPNPERLFVQDYMGLQVSHIETGQDYGTLQDVMVTGANLVFVIIDDQGEERLIPDIPQVIRKVDLEKGTMKILPLKGLFDHED